MAGLFSNDAPAYAGQPAPAKSGGFLGMFPSTPDYAPAPPAPANPAPSSNGKPADGSTSASPTAPTVPAVELVLKVADVIDLRGSLAVPPWLLAIAPELLAALAPYVRRWIAAERRRAADGGEPPIEPYDPACVPPEAAPEGAYGCSEVEQRVWDRE